MKALVTEGRVFLGALLFSGFASGGTMFAHFKRGGTPTSNMRRHRVLSAVTSTRSTRCRAPSRVVTLSSTSLPKWVVWESNREYYDTNVVERVTCSSCVSATALSDLSIRASQRLSSVAMMPKA
jgi:hypothetical protein